MLHLPRPRAAALLAAFVTLLAPAPAGARQIAGVRVSTLEQIKEDLATVPCRDEERLAGVRALFEKAGAPSAAVSLDKYKGVENMTVVVRGQSEERIVVGAHYDKVSEGCGALDNWTGVVALSHLFRSLKDAPLRKTLVFVAFGKEESGLLGSRAMASAIGKDQAEQYCAMINLDGLGLGPPQVADNLSSRKLGELAARSAGEMKLPFAHASMDGADSDSRPFMERKIPAVTIHGLSNEGLAVIHTRNDQASKVKPFSVYLGYRLGLAMLAHLDQSPCAAYR